MEEYLAAERVSGTNQKRTMRAVRSLVRGDGVPYPKDATPRVVLVFLVALEKRSRGHVFSSRPYSRRIHCSRLPRIHAVL